MYPASVSCVGRSWLSPILVCFPTGKPERYEQEQQLPVAYARVAHGFTTTFDPYGGLQSTSLRPRKIHEHLGHAGQFGRFDWSLIRLAP